jgi:hypothetical protein
MRNVLNSLIVAILLMGLVSCTIDNPVDTPIPSGAALSTQAYQPFALPAGNGLQKTVKISGTVTAAEGGQLSFEHSKGNFAVKIVLSFGPGAVESDMTLDMFADDEVLSATFGPHGTQFKKPGTLYVEARGLDVNGDVNALKNRLKLLYKNELTGNWEPIEAYGFQVDASTGTVVCKNGVIKHFSRYGFGI